MRVTSCRASPWPRLRGVRSLKGPGLDVRFTEVFARKVDSLITSATAPAVPPPAGTLRSLKRTCPFHSLPHSLLFFFAFSL